MQSPAEAKAMVSVTGGGGGVRKRRRTDAGCPAAETRRKQRLVSKLCDDVDSSSSPARSDATRPRAEGQAAAGHVSSWYLQYGDVAFRLQREKEAQCPPCSSLARQPQLTEEARCKLVSWLIPVHKHLSLSFECCCLAVNIMDRFLASTAVAADCFQLLGVTALLLASKQVEVCSPRISHLLSLCCDSFTKEQLCNLECLVLLRLNFCLAAPTLAFFLDYYTNCIEAAQLVTESTHAERFAAVNADSMFPRQCSRLARQVCELSLADYAFNKYPPSLTASCALRISSEILKSEEELVKLWCSSVDVVFTQPASAQSADSPKMSECHIQTMKCHFLPVGQESHDSLARECKSNLKLLVSLNQDSLEAMSTM